MIRLLIADDHTLLTESLCMAFEKYEDLKVVGTAHNGLEAVKKCEELLPDMVLMDVKMPEINGIEATRLIKESFPDIKVAILTSLEDGKSIINTMHKGADSYLLKDTPTDKLVDSIRLIVSGFYILSGTARQILSIEIFNGDVALPKEIKGLKLEDIEIIKCVSEGKTSAEIGRTLGYSDGTLKNKISRLLEATGVENRSQLVMYAIKHNII